MIARIELTNARISQRYARLAAAEAAEWMEPRNIELCGYAACVESAIYCQERAALYSAHARKVLGIAA